MFLYFLVSIPVRAYAHIYIYIYIKEVIKTEATKRKQCHTLDDSVSTIAMNLEKKKIISHNKPLVIIKLLVSDTCNV